MEFKVTERDLSDIYTDLCEISCIVEKPERETENTIKDCESQNSSELNVCSMALLELPLDLFRLTWLRVLWLSNNALFDLPKELTQLVNLEVLGLAWNHFKEISPSVWQLKQLKVLDLSNNNLERIPPEMAKCTQLQYLFLSNNAISSVPPQIGNLEKLVQFHLDNNKLDKLPVTVGNLKRLNSTNSATFYISHNFFEGNNLRYPPPTVPAVSSSQLEFLRQEWRQLPEEQQTRLLTAGLESWHIFRIEVQFLQKSYAVEASAATLCELQSEIWHVLQDYHVVKLPQLNILDIHTGSWKVVTTLKQAQSGGKLKVTVPKNPQATPSPRTHLRDGALHILRHCNDLLEDMHKLNTEDAGKNWKAMASRLGFTNNEMLSSWEQTGNPVKCVLHTWLNSKGANIQTLHQVLQQLEHHEIAARIPVQMFEAC